MRQSDRGAMVVPTTLGPSLCREGEVWVLDLDPVLIINGLSVLAQELAEQIVAQHRSDCIDINVERRLSPRENSELINLLGISSVKVTAEHESLADIVGRVELLEGCLRSLLGTLQRERYRTAVIPAGGSRASTALLADFERTGVPCRHRFVLEYVPSNFDRSRGFLRITVEHPGRRRLNLASIPHLEIDDFAERTFIAGSTRIAHTWADLVRRETERGRRSFVEGRSIHKQLFAQLEAGGLGLVERIAIRWSEAAVPFILEGDLAIVSRRFKRVLLAIEDNNLRALLAQRQIVRVDSEGDSVFIDVSHLGRVLNLSLGERRERADVETYLDRMPAVKAIALGVTDRPLAGIHVFLIHHNTAEILGFIAALRHLGCRDLTCLFVVYAGEAPATFLDALHNLPSDEVRCLALANVPIPGSVGGHYRLSKQYSILANEREISRAIRAHDRSFLDAMRAAGAVAFFEQLANAKAAGRQLLLIEDGGYLAPVLNRAARQMTPYREFIAAYDIRSDDERSIDRLLQDTFIGSVEHTRNGHDRLHQVEQELGLFAPAYSIAISRLKVEAEAHEVAVSILNAIENVLHASGRILSRRHVLVIGSRGAIGSRMVAALTSRLVSPAKQLYGLDLLATGSDRGVVPQYASLSDADPNRWYDTDVVVGVTGTSVLTGAQIEDWILHSRAAELALVSGSTKTAEFSGVMTWLNALMNDRQPKVGSHLVMVQQDKIVEPLTGRIFGQRLRITARESPRAFAPKQLVLMAQLTPVNFLFYGVPTELIDEVLAQLLSVSLGLLRQASAAAAVPKLMAVDREIDVCGRPLTLQ